MSVSVSEAKIDAYQIGRKKAIKRPQADPINDLSLEFLPGTGRLVHLLHLGSLRIRDLKPKKHRVQIGRGKSNNASIYFILVAR